MHTTTPSPELRGSCLARLRMWAEQGRGSVTAIASFTLAGPEQALNVSIKDFAARCKASVSSVSRFCTIIGYAGYKEFQLDLAASLAQQPPLLGVFDEHTPPRQIVHQVFECNRRSLNETEKMIDTKILVQVARLIHKSQRVYILGVGGSGTTAQQASVRFMSLGLTCAALTDPYLQVFVTSNLGKNDTVIGISHTGMTRSVVEGIETARACAAHTVALTNYPQSALAKASHFVLTTSFEERRANAAVSSSHIAQLCIIDALYFVVGSWRSPCASALAEVAEKRVQRLLR